MKKYNKGLFIRIILLVLISILIGMTVAFNILWVVPILVGAEAYAIYSLSKYLNRNIKDMGRFVDAIRFHEFNISFKGFEDKGLYPELIQKMDNAIQEFNRRIYEIEKEQNFYDALLGRIDAGLIVINEKQDVHWINKAALDIIGKPQPRNLNDLKGSSQHLQTIFEKIVPRETHVVKVEKERKSYNLLVTAVLLNIGGLEYKLISIKNIQTALDENENEAWKKLIKVLTHEIMNSIAPIISLSDTFSRKGSRTDEDMVYEAMQAIHRRSKGLVDFVNNYKKLTHILLPDYSTFTAESLLNDIFNLLSANGVKFTFEINPSDMLIEADRAQLEQVLINLINNAWEAASQQEKPEVYVNIGQNEYGKPIITVSDNGYGISQELLDKIFIPFFTTKKEGSGIGLSICRQIINAHGGTITAESVLDSGSLFTIKL